MPILIGNVLCRLCTFHHFYWTTLSLTSLGSWHSTKTLDLETWARWWTWLKFIKFIKFVRQRFTQVTNYIVLATHEKFHLFKFGPMMTLRISAIQCTKDRPNIRLETSPFCASEEYRDSRISGFTEIWGEREQKNSEEHFKREWLASSLAPNMSK